MPFIYDNLIAVLIGMTVLLVLASIQIEATQSNTAQTSRNVAITQAEQLATWLEEDLSRIGQNMPSETVPHEWPTDSDSTDWHTTDFGFEYKKSNGTPSTVDYDLVKTGQTEAIGEDEIRLLKLNRSPDGGASNLEYFEIDFLGKDGGAVANADNIEIVRVRFAVVAPFQNDNTIPRRVRRSITIPYRPG